MLGVDPEIGISALRLWIAAGSAALLVVVCALAFVRTQRGALGSAMRSGAVILGAIFGATMSWAFLDSAVVPDQATERRALEMRAEELAGRALAPGSPLACLDALTGENLDAACEKAVFASPASVAAATSYAAARLALFSDMVAYSGRGGVDIDNALLPLRRSLEADRFGFLAQALAVRDGCTSQNCKALELLSDPSRVRANLTGETFDRYLEHYLTVWAQPADGAAVADATRPPQNAAGLPGPHKVMVDIDFPSAASIPAVSIMNAEPKGPVPPGAAAAAAANPTTPAPAAAALPERKSRKHAANQPVQSPPPQDVPATAFVTAPSGPVWAPAASPPAPPAANFAPGGAAPVQLNPFPSPPEANAGMTMRAQ